MLTLIPLPWKIGGALALAGALAAAGIAYHHHVYQQGVSAESSRRDVIEAANSARANKERDALNVQIATAQASLTAARASLAKLEKELSDEKSISTQRQRDLLAGRERMSVLTRQRPTDPNGQAQGGAAGNVGPGAGITADLDGRVASDLEWARETRNEAIKRLNACILDYDAVKAAADAMP